MWRGGTSEDGWSLASGAGTWGTPELVHQSVVQKAVYDVDIRFGLKFLGHQGIGLVRWPLWGWTMEFAIWSRALWGNHGLRQRLVQNAVYDVDIEHDFGVLGHQGMGLARWPLWGWMEFAIWSTAWGTPGLVRQSVVQNAIYGVDIILLFWGPWEPMAWGWGWAPGAANET